MTTKTTRRPAVAETGATARDLIWALDPAQFATAAGLPPDDWQADVLHSSASRLLLNCARQAGKTTVTSVLGLHTALYDPGALVLLLSPSQRQSQLLFRKLLAVYHALEQPVPAVAENALSLDLANGSQIVALPGKESTVRGFSAVRLLIIDEASRVSDALYRSLRPMLAVSGGRLVGLSTPFGKRGWWYEAWQAAHEGREVWDCYEVPATKVPRISRQFLAEERASLGEWWYVQEYDCQFVNVQGSLFSPEAIDAAFAGGGAAFFPDLEGESATADAEALADVLSDDFLGR